MALFLALLLVLILFGLGFAVKALFLLAVLAALLWVIGFFLTAPEARWYRW